MSVLLVAVSAGAAQKKKVEAKSVHLKALFAVSGELQEDVDLKSLQTDGWLKQESEFGDSEYVLYKVIPASDLPVTYYFGSAKLSISKLGVVETSVSVGDADAGASAQLFLPIDSKGVLQSVPNLKLKADGGDYASGAWSYNAEIEVSVH